MAQFFISYLGGDQPSSPEEGQKHFAKYKEWMASLGDALVSPANPLKATHTIQADGSISQSSSTHMSGYSIVEAPSIKDTLDMAKACPFLEINGTLEVSELIKMNM